MSKKILKFGIIGAGGRGINCFGTLLEQNPDVEVAALCDPNQVRMKIVSKQFSKKPKLYPEIEDMIDNEDLDAVVITSPDYCHADNAVAVLKKGMNVLIDKPLATTVKGCKEIIKAAEDSGKTVMIGFNLRHDPTLKRLKKLIDDGVLGKVFLVENREFYDGGKTYMSRWNRKYELSGGLWVHKGSHDFDVCQWLLGFPTPVKVSACAGVNILNEENLPFETEEGKPAGPTCSACAYKDICPDYHYRETGLPEEWGEEATKVDNYHKDLCMYLSDKNTHDNGFSIVEYDNGSRASHMECFITPFSDRMYTVVGDKGVAEVSLHQKTIVVRPRWSGEIDTYKIPEISGGHGGADPGLVSSFIDIIKGSSSNTSTAEHGMMSTAVGQAAEISCRENRTVFIEELMKG
jgi:predicted dehydrogenase